MKPVERLRSYMLKNGLDAVLVTSELNQRYLTNFPFTDGYVLVLSDAAYLITDFRYREAAEKDADSAFTVETPKAHLAFIDETLRSVNAKSLAVEENALSHLQYEKFTAFFSVPLSPISQAFDELRKVKDETEIQKIAAAQQLTDAAFKHILSVLSPNMTEIEVALELEFFMRRNGAEKTSFDTIAVSGTQSAVPHGVPRNVRLMKGFLTMDFGCIVDGYCSDMTRTVSIGHATDKMKRLYDTVLSAQTAALSVLRAGISGKDADKVARDIIDSSEFKGTFGHSLGHGVGLFIHESPRLSPGASEALVAGNIVTVEPGIYLPGKYGCRIEDMVAITEDGCQNFTKSPKELIEII